MKKINSGRSVLLEMAIAIIFLALSACIILQLFNAGHTAQQKSMKQTNALILAQDCLESYMALGNQFSGRSNYSEQENGFSYDQDGLTVFVQEKRECGDHGTFISGEVVVMQDEEVLVRLPLGKYEAAQ